MREKPCASLAVISSKALIMAASSAALLRVMAHSTACLIFANASSVGAKSGE